MTYWDTDGHSDMNLSPSYKPPSLPLTLFPFATPSKHPSITLHSSTHYTLTTMTLSIELPVCGRPPAQNLQILPMSHHRFLPRRNGPWCHLWRIQTRTHRHMACTTDNSHLQWVGILPLLASQLCQLQSVTVVSLDIFQTGVSSTRERKWFIERERKWFIETGHTITIIGQIHCHLLDWYTVRLYQQTPISFPRLEHTHTICMCMF